MARKRDHVKPVETQSGSDEEDGAGSSEESDSEPEQTATAMAIQEKSKPQQVSPPPPQSPSSSEEEEFGSETDMASDGPDSNVKPLASGQKSSNGARKTKSKPNAPEPEPATPTKPVVVAAKRPSEEDTATPTKDSKKKKTTAEFDTPKANQFQRLWTEDDEIVMLEGMIDYTNEKKSDPMADLNAFHEFIKKNLHIDFSRAQLQDKIRRLKKKYENNKSKEKVDKEKTFTKPHEQKSYVLSKMVWGNETAKEKANGSVVVRKSKVNVDAAVESEEVVMAKKVEVNSTEENMLRSGGEIYESGQGGLEWESDWNKLRVEEMELYFKQLEVRLAQSNLVLGAMQRGDHE